MHKIKTLKGKLYDGTTKRETNAEVSFCNGKIEIKVSGYGDFYSKKGEGVPIVVEKFDRRLQVVCWSDINEQDPTHYVKMEGARDKGRLSLKKLKELHA